MNKNKLGVFLFFCLSMICIYSCKSDKPVEQKINITPKKITSPYSIQLDFDKIPFKYISDYGFFLGKLSDFIPNEKVLFYEPVSSLFSDKSHKSRFIWMPENTSATIKKEAPYEFDYPNGTVIIKNFYYPKNFNNPQGEKQVIETRLLIKKENKWEAYPYLWNEEQTDAKYKITGTTLPVSFIDEKGKKHDINYIQPNKNQCKSCHNKKEQLLPIGPKARNLNFKLDYGNGILVNQLEKWVEVGYLSQFEGTEKYPCMVNYKDKKQNLQARAKAYLDINCGHCHNPDAPANTSGLFLNYEENNPDKWGVNKPPVAAGKGAGPHTYDIVPGIAAESILIYRMKSSEPGIAMPEIGRVMADDEGVELISKWIDEMK